MKSKACKKVLYVHHGDIKGGAPMSLKFLLDKIDHGKYDTTVVCRTKIEDAKFFEDKYTAVIVEPKIKPFHGSTVSGINFRQVVFNFFYALPTYFSMKKIVKNNMPDIIHLNSTCLFMCAVAAKHVNKEIRVICHVREPLLSNIWGNILKVMCFKYCDKFVAIDEYDGKTVDPSGIKTRVVYNFVDFKKFDYRIKSNILREELQLQDDTVIFLVLARVSAENGILELAKMWKECNFDKRSQLVIVGEIQGREVEYTQKCHEYLDDLNNAHILPFRTDTVNVIASSDVMLCPFVQPHFARLVVEGAAMGKTTLSNLIDGPKELIVDGKTGMFYSSTEQFRECVQELTDDSSLRNALGQGAYQRAMICFDAEKNSRETFKVYEDFWGE